MLLCQWGAASPECRLSGAGGEPDGWGVPSHFYLFPQLPVQRVAGSLFCCTLFHHSQAQCLPGWALASTLCLPPGHPRCTLRSLFFI